MKAIARFWALLPLLLLACADPQPAATGFKKAIQGGGDLAATREDPLKLKGQQLWKSKSCEACHQAIAATDKKDLSADILLSAGEIDAHKSVSPWITADEANALAAALSTQPAASASPLALGQKLWVDKGCGASSCHGDISTTPKRGRTAARILETKTLGPHSSVAAIWPNESEAAALEAALK